MTSNSDMSAMPFTDIEYDGEGKLFTYETHLGLTKLEHFTGLAMQGLITLKGSDCQDADITAKQCVRMAKALLAELDKVNDDEQ